MLLFSEVWLSPGAKDRRGFGFNICALHLSTSKVPLDFGGIFGSNPRVSVPNVDEGLRGKEHIPNLVNYQNGELHTGDALLLY